MWLTFRASHGIVYHMVDNTALDNVFHALADGTRRQMLASLSGGERRIGELAAPFSMSLAAASKHVKVLERAGLVKREVRGRTHVCRLEPAALAQADAWLAHYRQFWSTHLDRLETIFTNNAERQSNE